MVCYKSVVENVVDETIFLHNTFIFSCCWFQYLYYFLRGFSYLRSSFLFFLFKKAPTPLFLIRDKNKGQSSKNTTLTPSKTLPKKLWSLTC